MRKLTKLVLAAAVIAVSLPAAADKKSLEELRARADTARGQQCAEYCMDAAQALVEDSNQKFTDGQVEVAHQQLKQAVTYADRATQGSIDSRKRQKKTEIELRKLSRRMTDINQTLAVDDRPAVEDAIQAVEKMRTRLLMSMFDQD